MPTEASRSSSIVWSAGGRPSSKQRWGHIAQSASFPVTLPGECRSIGVIRPDCPSDSVIARRPFPGAPVHSAKDRAFCRSQMAVFGARCGHLDARRLSAFVDCTVLSMMTTVERRSHPPCLRHTCPTRIESGHSIRFGASADGHPARSSSVIARMGSIPCVRARCTADQVVR